MVHIPQTTARKYAQITSVSFRLKFLPEFHHCGCLQYLRRCFIPELTACYWPGVKDLAPSPGRRPKFPNLQSPTQSLLRSCKLRRVDGDVRLHFLQFEIL